MNSITKSVHPMYKQSIVLSVPETGVEAEGIMHFCSLARTHFENDYNKQPVIVEVMKEDGVTHIVARSD